ncbi:MAG: SDR family NAD(P)-dependent oxidoreductase [Planctomycetes bacterium]|nr:SDR family NAD(P)-dependent oxidoreductase [Planctomycetota bacterium]
MSFDNKVVLVTGGSRGIGRAIVEQFGEQGARVGIHFNRNRAAAEETLKSLPSGSHALFQADLSDPGAAETLTREVVEEMGRVDILVNNAGIYELHPIAEVSLQQWQKVWSETISTNLMGPAHLMYCVGRQLIERGGGRRVNVSSRGAFRGEPDAPAYGAAKAGLNALSQSLAKALAPHNIFVGVVAPGFVETDMAAELLAGPEGDGIRGQSPMNRVARPDEVARTVLFLASEGIDFLTGCIVDVNGASYLRS